jgi:hypothetical protein
MNNENFGDAPFIFNHLEVYFQSRPAILARIGSWNNKKFENCRIAGLTPTPNSRSCIGPDYSVASSAAQKKKLAHLARRIEESQIAGLTPVSGFAVCLILAAWLSAKPK